MAQKPAKRLVTLIKGDGKPFISKKIGRNQPCPCGSGKKHKKCCKGETEYYTMKDPELPKAAPYKEEAPLRIPKSFEEVEIGDEAYDCEFPDESQGTILLKAKGKNINRTRFKLLTADLEPEDIAAYNWVVVEMLTYGPTLFNYDGDPSGVITFKN